MRKRMVGIVPLLACGCASAPMVDLVPREAGVQTSSGTLEVRQESSTSTVVAGYAGPWRDWLVFDLTVVNRSDSVLRVEPEQFSISLTRSHGQKTRMLGQSIHAVGPLRTLDVLDRGQSRETLLWGVLLGLEGVLMAADWVHTIADADKLTQEDLDAHAEFSRDLLALGRGTAQVAGVRVAGLSDEYDRWSRRALLPTALAPGASVCGTIAVPGAPFRRWLAPYEPASYPSDWSITGPPKGSARQYRLTLCAPSILGGQRFEFDIGGQ